MKNRISPQAFCIIGQFHPDVDRSNTMITDMPYFRQDGALHVKKNEGGFFEDYDATEKQLAIIGKKWYAYDTCYDSIEEIA